MAFVKYPPETTSEAIDVFNQDVPLMHEVIHGDDNAEVLTENGLIPSVARALKLAIGNTDTEIDYGLVTSQVNDNFDYGSI